jgi:predicted restriction endonuclease
MTRRLKSLHDDRCQLCDTRLEFPAGTSYSEAHHLRPLGRPHNGPDVAANIVVVCPNCHALCDHGALMLVRSTIRACEGHEIEEEFIEYHNRKIRIQDSG